MDYDIKKGWYKNVEGDGLKNLMNEVFGNVAEEGEMLVSSFGVLARIEVQIAAKDKMILNTVNREGPMTDDEVLGSKRKLNEFAEKATGFNAKARMKRAQDKVKKGLA